MKCYKLTNQNQETKNNTKWNIDEWNGIKDVDATKELCSEYWLHAYQNPYIAVLMNPIHAVIDNPRLFEAEAEGEFKYDGQLKFGCTRLRIVKEIKLPEITTEQRVKIAIYCALEVCKDNTFKKWANDWLSGKDRTKKSATTIGLHTIGTIKISSDAAYYFSIDCYKWARQEAAYAIEHAVRFNPKLDVIKIIEKVLKE